MPKRSNLWMLSMPSIIESLHPSRANRLSILNVANENLEEAEGGGPGFVSIPPSNRRILLIREKKKSHERKIDFLEEGQYLTLLGPKKVHQVKQHKYFPRRKSVKQVHTNILRGNEHRFIRKKQKDLALKLPIAAL